MSNPLDPMIETLKSAEPRPEAIERAVTALRRPHPPRLVPFAVGVGTLSIFALWPRSGSGVAWAQVAAQAIPDRYVIRYEEVQDGKIVPTSTIWEDRPAHSYRMKFMPLKSVPNFDYDWIRTPQGQYFQLRPGFATYTRQLSEPRYERRPTLELSSLLTGEETKQVGVEREVETRVGKVDRYQISVGTTYVDPKTKRQVKTEGRNMAVFVAAGGTRILGWDQPAKDGKTVYRTTIEYPAKMDPSVFATPHSKDIRLYDLDEQRARAEKILAQPLGSANVKGQHMELRLVVQDAGKGIYTLWKGAPPNGDLTNRVKVLGHTNKEVYGLPVFTSTGVNGMRSPYGGHCVVIDREVKTVDLEVPVFAPGNPKSKFVGTATFRHVPVLQVSNLSAVPGVWPVQKVRYELDGNHYRLRPLERRP